VKHKEGAGQQKQQLAKLAAAKAASGGERSGERCFPITSLVAALAFVAIFAAVGGLSVLPWRHSSLPKRRERNACISISSSLQTIHDRCLFLVNSPAVPCKANFLKLCAVLCGCTTVCVRIRCPPLCFFVCCMSQQNPTCPATLSPCSHSFAGRASHSSLHPRRQRSSGISLSHILGPSKGSAATTAGASKARSGLVVSKQQGGSAAAAAHAGMAYRHAHLAHNGSANAIVAHVEDGIEVVHLFSGEPGRVQGCSAVG
jgi:hypothetical protein